MCDVAARGELPVSETCQRGIRHLSGTYQIPLTYKVPRKALGSVTAPAICVGAPRVGALGGLKRHACGWIEQVEAIDVDGQFELLALAGVGAPGQAGDEGHRASCR